MLAVVSGFLAVLGSGHSLSSDDGRLSLTDQVCCRGAAWLPQVVSLHDHGALRTGLGSRHDGKHMCRFGSDTLRSRSDF